MPTGNLNRVDVPNPNDFPQNIQDVMVKLYQSDSLQAVLTIITEYSEKFGLVNYDLARYFLLFLDDTLLATEQFIFSAGELPALRVWRDSEGNIMYSIHAVYGDLKKGDGTLVRVDSNHVDAAATVVKFIFDKEQRRPDIDPNMKIISPSIEA